jgi:hypothetical protein
LFFSSAAEAVAGALAMLVLMFLLVVFAAFTKTASSSLRVPALLLTWLLLVLFVVAATLTVSATFFSWPLSLSDLAHVLRGGPGPDQTSQPEPIVLTRDPRATPDNLPPRLVTPISQSSDARSIVSV